MNYEEFIEVSYFPLLFSLISPSILSDFSPISPGFPLFSVILPRFGLSPPFFFLFLPQIPVLPSKKTLVRTRVLTVYN